MSTSIRATDLIVAFSTALTAHKDQIRKGFGSPYIGHLMNVCGIVMEYGGTLDQQMAALLHDVLEDTPSSLDALIAMFGTQVVSIVRDLSDSTYDGGNKQAWRERKEAYLEHLRSLPNDDPALLVSAADKLDNLRSTLHSVRIHGERGFGVFKGKREGTLWYYDSLDKIFMEKAETPAQKALASEVHHTVLRLHGMLEQLGGSQPLLSVLHS